MAPVAPSSATARTDDEAPGAGGSNSTDAITGRTTASGCAPTTSMRAAREPGGGPYATYEREPSSETAIACPLHAAASPYDPSMPYRHGPAAAAPPPSPPPMHACRTGAAWAAAAGAESTAGAGFPAMSRTEPFPSETVQLWAGARMPPSPAAAAADAEAAAAKAAARSCPACPGVSAITSTSESAWDATRAPPRPTAAAAPMPDIGCPACVMLISPGRADVRLTASSKYSASEPARRFSSGRAGGGSRDGPDASSMMSGLAAVNSVPIQRFPAKSGIAVVVTLMSTEP